MAVHHTHKQSDTEKRLKLLNTQLYGKSVESKKSSVVESARLPVSRGESITDTAYLKQDLLKIALLSGLATAILLALYFSNILSRVTLF